MTRRGGRPRKDPRAVRTVKHGARFTGAEAAELERRARELGVGVAELLREAALGRPLPRRVEPSPIALRQWAELGRLASNLNQLQRAVNQGRVPGVSGPVVEELRGLLHDVRTALVGGER